MWFSTESAGSARRRRVSTRCKANMLSKPVISIVDVSFAFGQVVVLENASVDILANEFIAIIGPNGGGKTTLIKLIMGMLEPQRGTILVFGQSPWSVRRRFGYMPQHPRFDYEFPVSVMNVVLMGRLGHGLDIGPFGSSDRELATKALDVVGCADLGSRSFSALSAGQRQRVLIARSLVSEPEILILDEPTANLDPSVQGDLYDLLHKLNERMTVIIVSHDVGFVSKHVDRVVCVNREVVLHKASAIKGDVISTLYGEMGVHLVDHEHHSHE